MSLIETEFNDNEYNNWFYYKHKKFLHNIDTFYYSITFANDFTTDTEDFNVKNLRAYFKDIVDSYDLYFPGTENYNLNLIPGSFARYYNNRIECPELFDIFFSTRSLPNDDTAQMIIQLRSKLLWLQGVNAAFEYSFKVVEAFSKFFHLQISDVKENRIDYCWHSNYLTNPEKFFDIEHFADMKISRFKDANFHVAFRSDDGYDVDYVNMGRRSGNYFVRMYLKSKEVIEMNYKDWFLKIWLFNNLISRYDYYIYTKMYAVNSYVPMDIYRLQFYFEFGTDETFKAECLKYIEHYQKNGSINWKAVKKLADKLVPSVTKIVNVEYQCSRKATKSYCLVDYGRNTSKGVCKRIYDFFDNHIMICDYLTHDLFRLSDPASSKEKKARVDCEFWRRLRSTKMVDSKKYKNKIKLVRDNHHEHDYEMVKRKFVNAASTFSIFSKGFNDDDLLADIEDAICVLNDNDVHKAVNYKFKSSKRFDKHTFKGRFEDEFK